MKFGIIVSKDDLAGMNIASFLEGNLPSNMEMHFVEGNQCFSDQVDNLNVDAFVFASLHRSESKKPTLTVHPIGNWEKPEYGGKEGKICPTNSFLLKNYLLALNKKKDELGLEYEVSMEATHHGPSLTKPTVFLELGSSEKQWQDKEAAKVLADIILESTSLEGNYKSCIALGGGHYCSEFTKLVLRTEWAVGHVCPMYALPSFDEHLLTKALEATNPKPDAVVLDWKGLKKEKTRIKVMLEEQGLNVLRVRKLI